jgi:hypothetical protein
MATTWYTINFSNLYYDINHDFKATLQIGYNTFTNLIQAIYPIGPYPPGSSLTPTTNILDVAGQPFVYTSGTPTTTDNVWVYTGGSLPSINTQLFSVNGTAITINLNFNSGGINKIINIIYANTTNVNAFRYTEIRGIASYSVAGASTSSSLDVGQTCFGHNTKILCINDNEDEIYKCVKDLKVGDIVKTYKHGNIPIKKIKKLLIVNDNSSFTHNMYILRKTNENNLTEDLVLSGGHSLLVDHLTEEQEEKQKQIGFCHSIDDKKLMLVGLSELFEPFLEEKNYLVYHFILENYGDKCKRYGVYANGSLVETSSEEQF